MANKVQVGVGDAVYSKVDCKCDDGRGNVYRANSRPGKVASIDGDKVTFYVASNCWAIRGYYTVNIDDIKPMRKD